MNLTSSAQYLPLNLRSNYRYTVAIGNLTQDAVIEFQPPGQSSWFAYAGSEVTVADGTSGAISFVALSCPMRLAFLDTPSSPYFVCIAYEIFPGN